ncbi:hypothetical protein Pint_16481 [Pistacia integerrima]|uniref:Uncharacterized protein n=1 Tax=Pistacia integerrima TaxID=434235 RepID=A0ACC0Z8U1_9ROSI|nr:hypothetical protein Pint_16481 [Pistacia integerrima]
MATQMISTAATVATINGGAAAAQPSLVAPFSDLKSMSAFPVSRKSNNGDMRSLPSNGGLATTWEEEVQTLSYLLPLSREQLAKEVEYLLRQGWVPCLEFELQVSDYFVFVDAGFKHQ